MFLLWLPVAAHAHAEMFFPKVFSPNELPTTGFVFVNPDPVTANVSFYLIATTGNVLSTADVKIPTGGQLARLGSELFPDAKGSGWVYVFTDSEQMQGFWLNYDTQLTYLDGAEVEQYSDLGVDQIIPLVAGATELNIINPNVTRVSVTVRLFGTDQESAPAFATDISAVGAFQSDPSLMFPGADLTNARYVRIASSGNLIGSSTLIRSFLVSKDTAVINGINTSSSGSDIKFPHAVNGALGTANYTTVVGVTNLSATPQTVTFTFNPAAGSPVVVSRSIAGAGALRETLQVLFDLPSNFQTGWIEVTGTAGIAGFVAYADTVGGGLAVVPAATPQSGLFFAHIADGPPQWQTGLALLNATDSAANVEVYALNPSGSLIGGTQFSLDSGQKLANVIHELIPQTKGVNGGFIFVRTTNKIPLYGIELFYTEDLKVLSNVAAGNPVGVLTYTPPRPQ
jgi:hypothetical protein